VEDLVVAKGDRAPYSVVCLAPAVLVGERGLWLLDLLSLSYVHNTLLSFPTSRKTLAIFVTNPSSIYKLPFIFLLICLVLVQHPAKILWYTPTNVCPSA